MNKFVKLLLLTGFIVLGFYAKSAFAFTCTAVAGGGNWNAAGTWSGCNSTIPQTGDDVVLDATSGDVVVNATTAALKSLVMTGYTGTLSGSSQINVVGSAGTTQNVILDGTITWTGTLQFNNAATAIINFTSNGKTPTTVIVNGSGNVVLQDNLTFAAVKTALLQDNVSNLGRLDLNGFTVSGNSSVNRLLYASNSIGNTAITNVNGGTFANADFRDIAFDNGGSNLDLSAITGFSGDCGGNGMSGGGTLTLTTPATQTSTGTASFTWSTHGWTSRVPLPQDDVVINNAFVSGRTVTMDMPRMGKNIDWSGATWAGTAPVWSFTSINSIYGSVTLVSGMSISNAALNTTFEGRGNATLTSAGVNWANTQLIVNMVGATLTLQDAYLSTRSVAVSGGTFDANDYNVTAASFNGGTSGTRILYMGNGTWTLTSTGNIWNVLSSMTLNAEGSTIVYTNTTATGKTFTGGGLTYNTVTFSGDNITTTGDNTIATLNLNNAGFANGTKFTGTSTTTITTLLTTNATSTAARAIATSTNASTWEIKYTGAGTVCVDYLTIARSLATPTNTFYAGTNSLDVGNNSGWTFSACPGGGAAATREEPIFLMIQ